MQQIFVRHYLENKHKLEVGPMWQRIEALAQELDVKLDRGLFAGVPVEAEVGN